jgi:hypothetical protein
MKNGVYNILKARFLIDDDAMKNWRFIVFLIQLLLWLLIHNVLRKFFKLTTEVKELRSEFVDRRSQLMKLKMESTVSQNGGKTNFPSTVPQLK